MHTHTHTHTHALNYYDNHKVNFKKFLCFKSNIYKKWEGSALCKGMYNVTLKMAQNF